MTGVTMETVVGKNKKSASRIIDGEAVIVLPEIGEIKVLNAVGSRIWDLLDGHRTVAEIAGTIHQEFEVAAEQAQQDVIEFIGELCKLDMAAIEETK